MLLIAGLICSNLVTIAAPRGRYSAEGLLIIPTAALKALK
jgi:hypothetical protein